MQLVLLLGNGVLPWPCASSRHPHFCYSATLTVVPPIYAHRRRRSRPLLLTPLCPPSLPPSQPQDRYLLSAGIATPYLLPEGTSGAAAGPDGASNGGGGGGNLMANLVGVIAGWMEKLDGAVSFLGGWLRDRWSDLTQGGAQRMEQQEGEGAAPNARPRPTTDRVLGGVMVLAIAVFCVMVVRRPLVLRRMR